MKYCCQVKDYKMFRQGVDLRLCATNTLQRIFLNVSNKTIIVVNTNLYHVYSCDHIGLSGMTTWEWSRTHISNVV